MTRILCCGNRDRGDDAAGILVAEELKDQGIPVEVCSNDAFELIESWNDATDVLIVDAVLTGCRPGTIHSWDSQLPDFDDELAFSTHGFGLREAIRLSRLLGRVPVHLRIRGIEGQQFEIGNGVSAPVRKAATKLARELATEIRTGGERNP
jgi:hydrogenase maturation protease